MESIGFKANADVLADKTFQRILLMSIKAINAQIPLYCNSPLKNKGYAAAFKESNGLQALIGGVNSKIKLGGKKKSPEEDKAFRQMLADAYLYVTRLRDAARIVWHGSVLCDILDDSFAMSMFAESGRRLCKGVGIEVDDAIWAGFEAKSKKQAATSKDMRDFFFKNIDKDISEEQVADLLTNYDTSFEEVQKDILRFNEMGTPKKVFKNPNADEEINIKVKDILDQKDVYSLWSISQNLKPVLDDEGQIQNRSDQPLLFVLTYLGGRSVFTPDMYGRALADELQKKVGNQTRTQQAFDLIKSKIGTTADGGQTINLKHAQDAQVIKDVATALDAESQKAGADALTATHASGDQQVALSVEGYNAHTVRALVNKTFKAKGGNPGLTLTTEGHITVEEISEISFDGVTYKGAPGQAYWTIGTDPDCDIMIPKTKASFGTTMAIFIQEGKFFAVDLSTTGGKFQPSVQYPEKEPCPLKQGDVLSFAGCAAFGVHVLNDQNLGLKFLNLAFSESEPAPTTEMAWNEGQLVVGKKLKKPQADFELDCDKLSRKHAEVKADSITDISSLGTYKVLRSLEEYERSQQSQLVEFNAAKSKIALYGFYFSVAASE